MTILSVLENVQRVVADLVRPRSQSQLSYGGLTDMRIGMVVAVVACVMSCIVATLGFEDRICLWNVS